MNKKESKDRKPAQQRDYPPNYYENADTHPIRKACKNKIQLHG